MNGRSEPVPFFNNERPSRAELFSIDQLGQHAKSLAGWHQVVSSSEPDQLLGRLEQNESALLGAIKDSRPAPF